MDLTRTEQMLLQAIKAALCGAQVDWTDVSAQEFDEMMRLALQHKLQPLVLQAIYDCPAAKAWPKLEENRQRAKAQVVAQAAKTEEFLSLYQAFCDAGCQPLAVKGILCRELYPNGDLRQSGDEDLFAAPQKFSACCKVLRENGFVPMGQADIDTADEIGWHKQGSLLRVELHRSLFSQKTEAVKDLQKFFAGSFEAQKTYRIKNGNSVSAMSEHDHLLYLIMHAYKHFIRSGFGVRQVCDIGLWAKTYRDEIDWSRLFRQCEQAKVLKFAKAVFLIAQREFSAAPELPEPWTQVEADPVPMLKDLLTAGIYGSADQNRAHTASVTQNSVSAQKRNRRGSFLKSVFPPKSAMQQDYPVLQKHGILLPIYWVKRLFTYRKELGQNKTQGIAQTVKIANERKKLLQLYDIL